jgi:hypothetical protein
MLHGATPLPWPAFGRDRSDLVAGWLPNEIGATIPSFQASCTSVGSDAELVDPAFMVWPSPHHHLSPPLSPYLTLSLSMYLCVCVRARAHAILDISEAHMEGGAFVGGGNGGSPTTEEMGRKVSRRGRGAASKSQVGTEEDDAFYTFVRGKK